MSLPKTTDYVGAGLGFPLDLNIQGSFQLSNDNASLEESIAIVLGTNIGERLYRPNFGSRLSELAFEPLNTHVLLLIRRYVRDALETWEPRMTIKEIITEPDPVSGRVDINILYQPKDSYDTRSMVYPFYLKPADELG